MDRALRRRRLASAAPRTVCSCRLFCSLLRGAAVLARRRLSGAFAPALPPRWRIEILRLWAFAACWCVLPTAAVATTNISIVFRLKNFVRARPCAMLAVLALLAGAAAILWSLWPRTPALPSAPVVHCHCHCASAATDTGASAEFGPLVAVLILGAGVAVGAAGAVWLLRRRPRPAPRARLAGYLH